MATRFLTDEQVAACGRCGAGLIDWEVLERFFFLDDADRKLIAKRPTTRRPAHTSGCRLPPDSLPMVLRGQDLAMAGGGARATTAYVRGLTQVPAKQLEAVTAAEKALQGQVKKMAAVGAGTTVRDAVDKTGVLDPVKELAKWGRYASAG